PRLMPIALRSHSGVWRRAPAADWRCWRRQSAVPAQPRPSERSGIALASAVIRLVPDCRPPLSAVVGRAVPALADFAPEPRPRLRAGFAERQFPTRRARVLLRLSFSTAPSRATTRPRACQVWNWRDSTATPTPAEWRHPPLVRLAARHKSRAAPRR